MSHELSQFLFCYQHFDVTGVPTLLKGNDSSLVDWKCSRLIYLKIC